MRAFAADPPLRILALLLCTGLGAWSPGVEAASAVTQNQAVFRSSPEPNWARYSASCNGPGSSGLLACGAIGKYQFGTVAPPVGCTPVASGIATLHPYPRQITPDGPPFSNPVSYLESQAIDAMDWTAGGSEAAAAPNANQDWIAVIDFDDDHGWSTSFLAGSTAGPGIEALLVPLDESESDALGPVVNDFHVLRALCSVVDHVELGEAAVPLTVNMSFGRLKASNETWYAGDCQAGRFSCQIAQVIGELRDLGTIVVGAAGNHGEMLFPAGLPDVVSAGMLDLHALFTTGTVTPVWETPEGVDALMPGGHLCLDDFWPAPAGTSYSSAMIAGWFAREHDQLPGNVPSQELPWVPQWDPIRSCHVLGDGFGSWGECNPAFATIIENLDGTRENPCWEQSQGTVALVSRPANGAEPPEIPSFDHWAETIQPTPSGDPCVPCVGLAHQGNPPQPVLEVNLSASVGLDPTVYIAAVFLKTLNGFDPIPLSNEDLEALRAGTLDRLDLTDYVLGNPETLEPALWYQLSDEPNPDCEGNSACFWDSSHILIEDNGF